LDFEKYYDIFDINDSKTGFVCPVNIIVANKNDGALFKHHLKPADANRVPN
jgi:hypothetical protein